jgi:hypothetical protein
MNKLQNIPITGKYICRGWNRLAFHLRPINIVRLVDETKEDHEKDGRRCNNIRGRKRLIA